MISILDPRALIAAIALCAASVGIGYWRGNVAGRASVQAKWDADKAEQAQIAASATAADTTAGQQASATYQEHLQDEKARIKVIRDVVVRTVAGPCLDDAGLFNVNQAIGGVPASSAAR